MKIIKFFLLLFMLIAIPVLLSAGKKTKKTHSRQKTKNEKVEVKPIKPFIVFTGVAGIRFPRSCRKITSKNEWAKLWLQNEGLPVEQEEYDYYYNTSRVPEIDFEHCMLIAIFEFKGSIVQGIPFGGFTAIETMEEKRSLTIRLGTKTFQTIEQPDSLKTDEPSSKTTLYTFIVIPRSIYKIILQTDARNHEQRANNSPPVWKEYAHIEP